MFDHNSVADTRNRLPFIEAHRGVQRPGRRKQHSLIYTLLYLGQNKRRKRGGGTAAAASPGVRVLRPPVIYLNPAIRMLRADVKPLLFQQIDQNGLSHIAEVSGDDAVVILRLPVKVMKF